MTRIAYDTPLPPCHNRLTGKVALVTGGASGLGAAIAARLDAEGAQVIVADIDLAGAQAMVASLVHNPLAVALDVAQEASWTAAMAAIRDQYGRLDILVNNAGITTMGSIEDLTLAAFKHELDIDVCGVFLGCQQGIALMKATGGAIINMSSAAGLRASHHLVGYNSAKAAVTLMTKSIALHCAREGYGIRCNSVHPGAIRTPILDKVLSQVEDPAGTLAGFVAEHPIGHLGHPDDIAGIVAWLGSDEGRFATGAAFSVDGGMTAL
jgi:NAD(P)-dependent dehydrogenase (short-subunit alcohol dehydrogenase family)